MIVNQTFVKIHLNEGTALGRRFRAPAAADGFEPGPWYEIVSVVEDLAPNETQATMYHPMAPGQVHPVALTLRVGPRISEDMGGGSAR